MLTSLQLTATAMQISTAKIGNKKSGIFLLLLFTVADFCLLLHIREITKICFFFENAAFLILFRTEHDTTTWKEKECV